MLIANRDFTDEIVERIRVAVRSTADLTRCALSRLVCGWMDWHGFDGRAKEASCRAALLKLERRGVIELPPAREVSFEPRTQAAVQPEPEWLRIKGALSKLSGIALVVVNGDKALSREWRVMMRAHHPLSDGPLCGAQLRYFVTSDQGILGGLSFSAAAWRLGVRDEWIGWSEATRAQRLSMVAGNSRFLILPTVQVEHLASHVLGMASRQLGDDWQRHYGERPVLLETFVDSSRYQAEGTGYRAANWIDLGMTQGRGRQDRAREEQLQRKHVFVHPLRRDWREVLTAPLELPRLLPSVRTQPAADWAEEEFGRCRLDGRLTQRLMTIARDFWGRPMANIPEACESATKMNAAYRFLANDDVLFETLLQPHYASTEERISKLDAGAIVLVPQDTTSLNYTALSASIDGLGPIGTTVDGAQGLHLHSSLAMTVQGVPLGFVDAQCWARDPDEFGKKAQRHALAIEDKESYRWIKSYEAVAAVQKRNPQLTLVSVGGRASRHLRVVRTGAGQSRRPRAARSSQAQPRVAGRTAAHVRDGPGQDDRRVPVGPLATPEGSARTPGPKLAIRFSCVTLCPPQGKAQLPNIEIQMVLAQEEDAPEDAEPIEWKLLTTMAVDSFEQACEKLAWYTQRWGIEVFHRTLKSGCRIEDRQLGHADRLEACLAIDMVIAWRIYYLTKLGREVPDLPADVFFDEDECKVLLAYRNKSQSRSKRKKQVPPAQDMNLYEAIRLIAQMGGFVGRKSDGEPGTETMWRGLQRFDGMTEGWRLVSGP